MDEVDEKQDEVDEKKDRPKWADICSEDTPEAREPLVALAGGLSSITVLPLAEVAPRDRARRRRRRRCCASARGAKNIFASAMALEDGAARTPNQ